ncbi:MAG TPA: thiamine pyrophosphate-dependent enzyme [Acidimicrobiia bacterium]|nr:thiamine pyrophosphate-dependent enzyme [Acidimicrobiia bacterium]
MATTTIVTGHDRLPALMSLMTGDEKHDRSATSTLDVLWVLYDRFLDIDPDRPEDPDRDRFLLSKGHGPMAYYAVLTAKGFIDEALLPGFGGYGSPLGQHPDRVLLPGVEIGSGSLGHGLPIAVGTALALRARGRAARVVCLVGDGELDEGSNHEAIALAGRLALDRLIAVVVDNASATHGWPGGIGRRFTVEGWTSAEADGRDHDDLERALHETTPGRPHVVVVGAGGSA